MSVNLDMSCTVQVSKYRIALNFGGAKLWRISLHKNFEVLNFGETNTKQIIMHNLENFGGLYWVIER